MKKLTYFVFLLFLVFSFSSFAQKDKEKILDSAYIYFSLGNYQHALPLFMKVYESESGNANLSYHIGVCYTHMPAEKFKAIPYLEMASRNVSKDYSGNKTDETRAPVLAYFNLGTSYLINYDLGNAISATEQYKTYLDAGDSVNIRKADRQIAMCHVAREMLKNPVPIRVENLREHINTIYPEYAPVVDTSGKLLFFTARRDVNIGDMVEDNGYYFEDVYVSKMGDDGKWSEAENMGKIVNSFDHEASISLSPDKRQLFIYKDDGGDGNIYISNLIDNKWTAPEKLPSPINSRSWENHASLSRDGKILYFTSDRPGGYGGLDIYKSEKKPNGKWGKEINLGDSINTEFNEDGPFILSNNVLYFCSEGHNTMGGYDIFYSKLKKDSTWSKPVNMGYPINTTDDDLFFTPVDSANAYFASVRILDYLGVKSFGNLDIYRLYIHQIKISGIALDKNTNEVIPGAKVFLLNEKLEEEEVAIADSNGAFSFAADYNRKYTVKVNKETYTVDSTEVSTYDLPEDLKVVNVELRLEKTLVSLRIQVTDAETSERLEDVAIVLNDLKSDNISNMATDSNGETLKSLNDKKVNDSLRYLIAFSKEGYLPKNIDYRYRIEKPGEILIKEELAKTGKIIIKGLTLDKNTGEIIPKAEVWLMNDQKEVIDSALSGENGAFSFAADYDKNYNLKAQKVSYTDGVNTASTYNMGNTKEVNVNLLLEKSPAVSLRILVTDAKTDQPLHNVSVLLNDRISGKIENLMTNEKGEIYKSLDNKKINDSLRYDIKLVKEEYVSKDVEYKYLITKPGEILIKETLGKIEVGVDLAKVIQIKHIYFDFDKYYIRPDAKPELDKIVKIMNEYPTIVVECGSHTDCRNTYAYNEVLSDNRAKSSVAYIVSKGIDPKRITGRGYGEYRLFTNCPCEGSQETVCTEENHQLNRRTEFIITGFIDGMGNVSIKSEKGENIHTDPKPNRPRKSLMTFNNFKQSEKNELVYRIQILAVTEMLSDDYFFKGLSPVEYYKHKGYYKYIWGEASDIQKATQLLEFVKSTGVQDAFIVPFYNNERITMEEAEKIKQQ